MSSKENTLSCGGGCDKLIMESKKFLKTSKRLSVKAKKPKTDDSILHENDDDMNWLEQTRKNKIGTYLYEHELNYFIKRITCRHWLIHLERSFESIKFFKSDYRIENYKKQQREF